MNEANLGVVNIFKATLVKSRFKTVLFLCFCALLTTACDQSAVTTAQIGKLAQQVDVTGELVSSDTVSLTPPAIKQVWQYQISRLVPEGQWVQKGDVVAQLDTAELNQRLSVISANFETTEQDLATSKLRNEQKLQQLELSLAEAKMNQDKAHLKVNISDETVSMIDQKKYQFDAEIADSNVKLIEQKILLEKASAKQRVKMLAGDRKKFALEIKLLKKGIASLTLKAPRAGIVVYGNDSTGNKIAEGQSVYVGDEVVSIPDLKHMQINMTIPEVEARRIVLGQAIKIRLDANPEKIFKGKIIHLGAIFRHKAADIPLVVFDAIADIAKPDTDLMRPGMTAKINIELTQAKPQLLLPIDAIHYERGKAYVLKPSLFGHVKHYVTLGTIGKEQAVITSGLNVNEKVLLP